MKIAIVFLTTELTPERLFFARELSRKVDGVHIMFDEQSEINYGVVECNPFGLTLVNISDITSAEAGYQNSNIVGKTHIIKNPIALDKALYYFCETHPEYDFVWMFENDCFIPGVAAINNLINKYSTMDLVVSRNDENKAGTRMDWHWPSIYEKHYPPFFSSMICAVGMSRTLLNLIKEYATSNKSLFYCEVMFNTLAMQNGLQVTVAPELDTIYFLKMPSFGLSDFKEKPLNIFHPVKEISEHQKYREQLCLQ
jgi:hypothetical protein